MRHDFQFTSPLDNRLDRATYFSRCWPNSETTAAFEFMHLVTAGDHVFVAYEATTTQGKRFRNTEIMRICEGRIREVGIYFGWDVQHQAAAGAFVERN